ncbi:MAG TPA: PAS domain S-box protein [Kiritimatiellia bacterium]|nr:PAS domain S-box protein [Kiritimatiellia bacterium]HPS07404.1 PAS domain S-box protein [Kiritimatiellia bacterium]
MAMKFWFGKKGTEPDESAGATGALPVATPNRAESGAPPSPAESATSAVPQGPDAVSVGGSPSAGIPPAPRAAVDVGSAAPLPLAVSPQTVSGPEAGVNKGSASSSPAAETADVPRTVLKAVGGIAPVRLTAVHPAGSGPQTAGSAPVAGAGRPVFALRPKNDSTAAPAAGAEITPPTGVQTEGGPAPAGKMAGGPGDGNELIRPKTDQRALYYQLMNGLYDAVLILDDQGHVVDSSKRVSELLGYSREDTWDLGIDKIITGMTRQMFEHLRRSLSESNHVLIDARCSRQDGTSFSGEVGVSTLSLTTGSNIVFAIRNVERRKTAMEDLRKCQAALDVALVPVFVCDTDGFFQMVNQTLLDAFGIPDAAQAKSVRFVDLLPDAARFFLRAACGEKVHEKISVATPDGMPLKLEISLAPVQSGSNITGVAGSILQM